MTVEILIKISDKRLNNPNLPPNLHPNYQLLREISKQGILNDQLMNKLQFF